MHSLSHQAFVGALMAMLVSMETTNAVQAWPCPYRCECDSRQQTVRCINLGYDPKYATLPSDIKSLHISNQNITSVTTLSQSNLMNLRKLEIVRSNIRELQDNAFDMAPKIRRLNLSDNFIKHVPRTVSSLVVLKELILRNNLISLLKLEDFNNLTKLRYLDLSINNISTLPRGIFDQLKELRRLNLSYNNIVGIYNHTFTSLTLLEDLFLSENKIKQLSPRWMDSLSSLWLLEMNKAILEQTETANILPEHGEVRYGNLKQVRIAANGIREIPCDALRPLMSLELLDMSYNKITSVPDYCFYGMSSLAELLLISNDITQIEQLAFYNVTSLTALDVSTNKLQSLTPYTFGSTQLAFLYMDDNNFRIIEDDMFLGAYSLRQLFLRGNEIREVSPHAFRFTYYLGVVDFRDNYLTSINSEFINMSYLTSLAFTGNRISSIQTNAFEGTYIRHIHLENNTLTSLPEEILSYTPYLEMLRLVGNPWHCDCTIRYLCEGIIDCLNMNTGSEPAGTPWCHDQFEMMCTSPKSFESELLRDIKPFQMICTTYASALAIQLIVGLSLSAVAISTALYVVQLYCKAKKLERNGGDAGKCLA